VRRCKQIIEVIDIDPTTKEILTNEVFRWDPVEDKFIYTGKSYVLEGIRARWDISKEEITQEIRKRAEILEWMRQHDVRTFKEVAKVISRYAENPDDFLKQIRQKKEKNLLDDETDDDAENSKKQSEEKDKSKEDKNEKVKNIEEAVEEFGESSADEKIDVFKDIKSIDEDTATLLYESGYTSLDALKNASVKDLSDIKDIKKKTAKKIKEEIEEK
jgi:hypothetical protein